ncbi:MAG: hypothetical protein JXR62_03970 [Bacilli bacterium]|nr:hypothetical protein [Bacilli bacterium]
MKKICSIISLFLLLGVLTGCDLAIEDDYYIQTEYENGGKTTEDYYIPSGIEFTVYKGEINSVEIDVSDYFYVNFACPDMTVFDDCSSTDIGKSIDSSGTKIHIAESTINNVEQATVITNTIELTFYALNNNDLSIHHTIIFENEFGDKRVEHGFGTNFASGVALSGTVEGEKEDGTIYVLEYIFHYEVVDALQLVTIKQFDQYDNLLRETQVPSNALLDEIVLDEDTKYYFVIEDYIDIDGNSYQERIYNDITTPFYYLYKYCNEDGFLNGDRLMIHTTEEN